jgi:LPS export ABC transporter protein LptC
MISSLLRSLFVLAVLGAVAAGLYGSYWLLRDADVSMPSLLQPAQGKKLMISMDGFRLVQTENGRAAWSVTSSGADLFENQEALLRDVEVLFNDPKGRTAALLGETGTLDTTTGNASIRRGAGDVRVVTSDGYLLTTDTLFWRSADRVVRTPSPFKVLGREIYIEGTGMTADVELENVVVNSNVKAVLQE